MNRFASYWTQNVFIKLYQLSGEGYVVKRKNIKIHLPTESFD